MNPELKIIRDVFGLSQRDLAKVLNVSHATVVRWEMPSGAGANEPTGLHREVLGALHLIADEVKDDEVGRRRIAGMLQLGIGALIFYLLRQEVGRWTRTPL